MSHFISLLLLTCVSYLMLLQSELITDKNLAFLLSFLLSPVVSFLLYVLNWFQAHLTGISFVNHKSLVRNCYDTADNFIGNKHTDTGLDYGYNFYNGDQSLKPKEAQLAKYEYMWKKLELAAGKKLLDIGCGYGDWMKYCQNRGVEVLGINISASQCKKLRERGLPVINKDWEQVTFDELKLTKFDAITCMDTIEHYASPFHKFRRHLSDRKYQNLFDLIKGSLTRDGIFLTSCLFQQTPYRQWSLKLWTAAFIIDHSMGGYYPQLNGTIMGHDQLTVAASRNHLKLHEALDTTENYRISQVWNTESWQNANNLSNKSVLWLVWNIFKTYFTSPSFFMSLIGYFNLGWTTFWGEDPLNPEYNEPRRKRISHIRCYMATYR